MTTPKTPGPGRNPKGAETRKAVSFRLQPSTIEKLKGAAKDLGCSQSDLIEDWIAEWLG